MTGLTSRHIFGETTVQLGLATHFVPFERFEELENELFKCKDFDQVKETVDSFSVPATGLNSNFWQVSRDIFPIVYSLETLRTRFFTILIIRTSTACSRN